MIWWINYLGIWKGMWGLWNPTPKKKLWLEVDISDKYSWASLAIFISGKSWFFSKLTAHNRFICCDPPLYTGHDTLTISWILKIQMRIEYLNDIYLAITLFNLTKMQKLVQQCRVAPHSVWKSSLKVSFVNKSQIFERSDCKQIKELNVTFGIKNQMRHFWVMFKHTVSTIKAQWHHTKSSKV